MSVPGFRLIMFSYHVQKLKNNNTKEGKIKRGKKKKTEQNPLRI